MYMEIRTVIEMIQVAIAYGFCVLIAPYIVFHARLKDKKLSEKFILCTVIGNFYIINIVFVIFLLHIPGRLTLYLFTLVPAVIGWLKINRPAVRQAFKTFTTSFTRLFLGEAQIKSIAAALLPTPRRIIRGTLRGIFSHFFHHILEWGMILALIGFNIYYYGYETVTKYIYGTSDIIVHNMWVNRMDDGIIFYKGVYPFGFHNVIYFLHNFCGIRTISVFRTFSVVQMIFIYLMIYLLLRRICRSRFIPIVGLFFFTLPDLYDFQGTMRYQWCIPQEFAMVYLYPCAYSMIQFFQRKRDEIAIEKKLKKEDKLYTWLDLYHLRPSTRSLIFFSISFSLTLACHFYITIIAVFLCLAVAIAYFPIVLHYRYFCSIAVAGFLSIFTAVAPMVTAYLQGTGLEGSLYWAMNSMSSGSEEESKDTVTSQAANEEGVVNYSEEEGFIVIDETLIDKEKKDAKKDQKDRSELFRREKYKDKTTSEKVRIFIGDLKQTVVSVAKTARKDLEAFNQKIVVCLKNVYNQEEFCRFCITAVEILAAAALLLVLFRRGFYFRNQLAIAIFFFFMVMLVSTGSFSLPSVMDVARGRIFTSYATPVFLACILDFAYTILCLPFHYFWLTEILPIGVGVCLTFLTITNNYVRPLNIVYSLQASGEMLCNYQIMDSYPDQKWTIVSTTNSIELIDKRGWHMELCTFLGNMHKLTDKTTLTIPSKYVFFYIEKYPLDYGSSGKVTEDLKTTDYISTDGAKKDAAYGGGGVYSTENRYILESKFFYWAKVFQTKYPQEFQVYYEDEFFICYRIIQNEYHLYNFAIDYNYN